MITFENQEAFETAVMNAIRFRCVMGVEVRCRGDEINVSAHISDERTGAFLASAQDHDTVVIHQSDIRD